MKGTIRVKTCECSMPDCDCWPKEYTCEGEYFPLPTPYEIGDVSGDVMVDFLSWSVDPGRINTWNLTIDGVPLTPPHGVSSECTIIPTHFGGDG